LSDKDYEVRSFIGKDFERLEPIAVRYNESLVELGTKENWKVDEKTGEVSMPEGSRKLHAVDIINTYFSLQEIMAIVKSGVKKPGVDHTKNYPASLVDIESWDADKIFKVYEEVMEVEKNRNFFVDSVSARSLHLTLELPQNI
jgi:hypothetical protein